MSVITKLSGFGNTYVVTPLVVVMVKVSELPEPEDDNDPDVVSVAVGAVVVSFVVIVLSPEFVVVISVTTVTEVPGEVAVPRRAFISDSRAAI